MLPPPSPQQLKKPCADAHGKDAPKIKPFEIIIIVAGVGLARAGFGLFRCGFAMIGIQINRNSIRTSSFERMRFQFCVIGIIKFMEIFFF
jgi:hypothetical protein